MSDGSRILILDGYDAHPRAVHTERSWCAVRQGRKTTVTAGVESCPGEVVTATSKAKAKSAAVRLFREQRASKKAARRAKYAGISSPGLSAAQRRFAAAAHACAGKGKGRSTGGGYLACMKSKLNK